MLLLFAFLLFWIMRALHGENALNVATYVYVAKTILEGGIPYRDAWDIKGPGIYYIFAVTMLLFGKTALGMEILEGIWQAVTALVLFRVALRIYKREAGGYVAASLYMIYLLCFATNGGIGEPDELIVLPMSLGILFLLRAGEDDRLGSWILAGLTMAVAALVKLPAASLGAVMMFAAVRQAPVRFRRVSARLASLAAGFLTPLLLCALWFHLNGALRDLWMAQFAFAPQYVRIFPAWGSPACLWMSFTRAVHLPLYAMGGLALVSVVLAGRKAWRGSEGLVLAWFLVAALNLFLHGLFFPYHFLPLSAPLAILSAVAILGWREQSSALRLTVTACVLLFLVMPVVRVPGILFKSLSTPGEEHVARDVWRPLALSLRARTTPEDTLFLWANVPHFYLDAERRPPSRYFHSLYLSMAWRGLGVHPQFLADLAAHKPKFFAVNKTGAIGGSCPFSHLDYFLAFQRFTELQQFLGAEYVLEQDTPRYLLYRRKDVAAPVAQRGPLGFEYDRLAVRGAAINGVSDLHGPQAVETRCGGCALAGGGADE